MKFQTNPGKFASLFLNTEKIILELNKISNRRLLVVRKTSPPADCIPYKYSYCTVRQQRVWPPIDIVVDLLTLLLALIVELIVGSNALTLKRCERNELNDRCSLKFSSD